MSRLSGHERRKRKRSGGSASNTLNHHAYKLTKNTKKATPTPPHPSNSSESASFSSSINDDEGFSSQKIIMDYVTLSGIQTRTSISSDTFHTFILKELLDNALDFIDTHPSVHSSNNNLFAGGFDIYVTLSVSVNSITFTISNINLTNKPIFQNVNKLKSIFDFTRYYSSKRDQFIVKRGALGDAFKEILCMPYASATEVHNLEPTWSRSNNNNNNSYPPLIISDITNNYQTKIQKIREYSIYLKVDKANQTIDTEINSDIKDLTFDEEANANNVVIYDGSRGGLEQRRQETKDITPRIEVKVTIPIKYQDIKSICSDLVNNTLAKHIIINPHISFYYNVLRYDYNQHSDNTRINECLYATQLKNKLQSSSSDLRRGSIGLYSYHEFKQLLNNYEDNNALLYDVLNSKIIEGTQLKKTDEFRILTIGDLKRSSLTTVTNNNENDKILSVFKELRRIKKSSSSKSKDNDLALAFNIKNKSQRKIALRERLEHFYGNVLNIEYRNIQETHYDKENDVSFPYIIEVAIAEIETTASFNRRMRVLQLRRQNNTNNTDGSEDKEKYYSLKIKSDFGRKILDTINNSPKVSGESVIVTKNIFEHTGYYFGWIDKKGELGQASTLSELLDKCGYVADIDLKNVSKNDINTLIHKKKKKLNRIFLINLISPKFYYKTVAKTDIDFEPFHEELSQLIYNVCMDDERYFRKALKNLKENGGEEENLTIKSETRIFIEERRKTVQEDPSIKETYPLTIRGISYMVKNRLIGKGMPAAEINSKTISGYIKEIVEKEMNLKRDDLGIYAADRAQLYFRGEWHDVNVKSLKSELLKLKGTDMIVIEKEDIVKSLTYYADQVGIALLNTRGYLTEYAEILANTTECNVVILTDFDIDGLNISMSQVPKIRRIGIDFKTLECLGLSRDDPRVKDDIGAESDSSSSTLLEEIGNNSTDNEDKKKSATRKKKRKIAIFNNVRELFNKDLAKQREKKQNNDTSVTGFSGIASSEQEVKEILDYLWNNRIEINQVLANVRPDVFWNKFILPKLLELFPTRNYLHAIKTNHDVNELSSLFKEASEYIQNDIDNRVLKKDKEEIEKKLRKVEGTLNVRKEEDKIIQGYKETMNKDKRLQDIFNLLKAAIEEDKKKAVAQDDNFGRC